MVKLKKQGEASFSSSAATGTIGERLKSVREHKGLSLEEVHRLTKIHPKTIEELEKGHLDNKLGETYTRAFLKNYAAFLGVDAKSIIEEYTSKKRASEPNKKEPAPEKDNSELVRAIITAIVLLAALVALTFGAVKIVQHTKNAFLKMSPVRKFFSNGVRSKPAKEIAKRAEKAQPAAPAAEIIPIPRQKALTLTLDATNDVWLKVIVDGNVAFHKTLSKKSKETWKAEKEIRLTEIGKPEALAMNVNGKDIDFSGKRPTRSILITHEGVNLEPK